jgi:transcription elongation factor Elf1
MPARPLQYSRTLSARQIHTSEANSRRKATLFCPSCGHESEVSGDWIVHTDDARETYDCPVCNTTITKRLQGASLLTPSD